MAHMAHIQDNEHAQEHRPLVHKGVSHTTSDKIYS